MRTLEQMQAAWNVLTPAQIAARTRMVRQVWMMVKERKQHALMRRTAPMSMTGFSRTRGDRQRQTELLRWMRSGYRYLSADPADSPRV